MALSLSTRRVVGAQAFGDHDWTRGRTDSARVPQNVKRPGTAGTVRGMAKESEAPMQDSVSQEPRAYTADEVRDMLIEHVWMMVHYWGGHEGSNVETDRPKDECLTGLAFSILAALDGSSMGIPAFKLVPDPHPDDEQYHRDEGTNWFSADAPVVDMLHEHFYRDDLRRDGR